MGRIALACLAVCLMAACGCGHGEPETIDELAAALQAEGVAYDVAETAALPRIKSDGLRLTGPGLKVEVFRIERERDMKLAVTAVTMVAVLGERDVGAPKVKPYVRRPFVIVVRNEPEEGLVKGALSRVFGE